MPSQAQTPGSLTVNTPKTISSLDYGQQHPGILRSAAPTWVRVYRIPYPYIHTSLRTLDPPYAGLLRVPETSTSSPMPLEGNRFRILKSVALKSYAGTPATSQLSGLPLPFPVPSKVWRHKQAGGTSLVSSSPLNTLLAQAPTRLPRSTHAHTYTHSVHRLRVRPPTPAAPRQHTPPGCI